MCPSVEPAAENAIPIFLTADIIRKINQASKDPDCEEDIQNLISLISQLDVAFQGDLKRTNGKFEEIANIVALSELLWGILNRYFDLRTKKPIRRSVTSGLILRYKVTKMLAILSDLRTNQRWTDPLLPSCPILIRSLIEFIKNKLEPRDTRPQSFSHLVVKALNLWEENQEVKRAFGELAIRISQGDLDESYANEMPSSIKLNGQRIHVY